MGINRMQGTSAHLEYIGPKGRKRKSNCIYYYDKICKNGRSATYLCKCVGRLYCKFYDDSNGINNCG